MRRVGLKNEMCELVSWGGYDWWLYRLSLAVGSVLWIDFFSLQEKSRELYVGINLTLHVVSIAVHELFIYLFATSSGTDCMGERPVRMPQYDSFSAAFFLTMALVHGFQYKSRRVFGAYRVVHALIAIVAAPFGIKPLIAFLYGECIASTLLGSVTGALFFSWMAFVINQFEPGYVVERDADILKAINS